MSDIRDFCPLWGEWEAESKLGEGSYGIVWKMRRKMLAGQVHYAAVKHISIPRDESEIQNLMDESVFTSQESAARYYDRMLDSLVNEINTMHQLRGYTNIVSYEDHKIIPKQKGIGYDLFLRMELLTPLTVRIRSKMTTADVIKLGCDIAEAIGVLNKVHLIHRDIKPQNIFVNNTGDYKLGDYGTARVLESDATAMSRKGTFNYMAPEIYNNQKADIRVDIYSLGLVLYRLLNGNRLPFLPLSGDITSSMNEEAVVRRLSGEEIPAPVNAEKDLARVVLKACAFRPENRYQSAADMKQDLEACAKPGSHVLKDGEMEQQDSDSLRFQFTANKQGSASFQGSGSESFSGLAAWETVDISEQKPMVTQPSGSQRPAVSQFTAPQEPASQPAAQKNSGRPGMKVLRIVIPLCVFALAGIVILLLNGGGSGPDGSDTSKPTVVAVSQEQGADYNEILNVVVTPTPKPAEQETESGTELPEEQPTEQGKAQIVTEQPEAQPIEQAEVQTVTEQPEAQPIEQAEVQSVTEQPEAQPIEQAEVQSVTEQPEEQPTEQAEEQTVTEQPEEQPTEQAEEQIVTEQPEAQPIEQAETQTVTEVSNLRGDVNGDGIINDEDVDLIRGYVAGWAAELDLEAADVNGDGTVDLADAVRLKRYISGQDVELQ